MFAWRDTVAIWSTVYQPFPQVVGTPVRQLMQLTLALPICCLSFPTPSMWAASEIRVLIFKVRHKDQKDSRPHICVLFLMKQSWQLTIWLSFSLFFGVCWERGNIYLLILFCFYFSGTEAEPIAYK